MPSVRVAILSDEQLFCDGLLRIVAAETSFVVVGHDEGAALGPAIRAACPDVLLVDSNMDGSLALCAALKRDGGPAVILVAAPADDDWARQALSAGARGILAKSARTEDLVKAIRLVHEGQIWARRQVLSVWMEHLGGASAAGHAGEAILEQRLSSREREVFRYAVTGLGNKEVADRLAISQATVKVHLTHIFQKLGLRGRTELAAAYYGIIHPAPERASPGRLHRPA